MAFEGFGKNSGPTITPKSNALFGNISPSNPSPDPSITPPHSSSTPTLYQPQQLPQESDRPVVLTSNLGDQQKLPVNIVYSGNYERLYPGGNSVSARDARTRFQAGPGNLHVPKRTKSLSVSPAEEGFPGVHYSAEADSERPDEFPTKLDYQKSPVHDSDSLLHQRLPTVAPYVYAHDSGTLFPPMPANSHGPKRTRSPPLPSAEASNGVIHSSQIDVEREMQAKAKRLARFNIELSQPMQSRHELPRHKASGSKMSLPSVNRSHDSTVASASSPIEGISSDYDGMEPATVIVGLCPDMCPELEREERERKGDLDKYERLDGERNQTSISIAVKKYSRTAERDAELIRPMPVLQKTIDYLLNLLDQPYDDKFLGIYNFLWDRMRAIRMDLRMQHLFNHDAIMMLEKMIRFHIIAMHELCGYKKGEGFSEGFDAHLNIEQMNKTSVELFQTYNDHRKQGSSIPTEKEFRGYYALLKLDKHPGYNVEPAELSLDLAKMTPEIRCTPEISFARDVARACRTGNFVAFFRLARRATYLQACLMHAHFAKLRTQALASLHSGLLNGQGIPARHVVKWLGMEGEDIYSLLEYHGFVLKKYEETYMVKEGPFLSSDVDYPTKCSELVHLKKSRRIINDVCFSQTLPCPIKGREVVSDTMDTFDVRNIEVSPIDTAVDEDMLDFEFGSTPKDVDRQPLLQEPSPTSLRNANEGLMAEICPIELPYSSADESLGCFPLPTMEGQVVQSNEVTCIDGVPLLNMGGSAVQVEAPERSNSGTIVSSSFPRMVLSEHLENEAMGLTLHQKDEAATAKLKLFLRIWKRRAVKKRETRDRKEVLANAALSLLSLGPPVRHNEAVGNPLKKHLSHSGVGLNIDHVVRERHGRHGKSWSRLNVSEVVATILSSRNPSASCLFWKLIVCSQLTDTEDKTDHLASTWLSSKLMGNREEDDNELVVSLTSISIWKKLVNVQVGYPRCCLSVIRDIIYHNSSSVDLDHLMVGVNAIMFLVSESIGWDIQRVRLHNLLMSIPSGSRLPLLILSGKHYGKGITDPSTVIINSLGLQHADETKISSYSVIFLVGNGPLEHHNGFFSDGQLRSGLQWLANTSPLQPILRQAKIRDLVLKYLDSSLAALESKKFSDASPDECILAFNEALDYSAEEIRIAADMNRNSWPSPEIELLEELTYEHQVVNMFLPSSGWSSPERIEPIIRDIKNCKLPSLLSDLAWLNEGSLMGRETLNQKSALEECLMKYLTETRIASGVLAAREAQIMVQKGATLELRGSYYHIIARWVMIFRRIFNWRLTNPTSGGDFTVAYVLDRDTTAITGGDELPHCSGNIPTTSLQEEADDVMDGECQNLHSIWTEPSLDEMIDVGCSSSSSVVVPVRQQHQSINDSSSVSLTPWEQQQSIISETTTANETGDVAQVIVECEKNGGGDEDGHRLPETDVIDVVEQKLPAFVDKGQSFNNLDLLLKQCDMLQNMIDEKLAIYF